MVIVALIVVGFIFWRVSRDGETTTPAGTPLTEPLYKSIGNAEDNRIPAKAKDGWLYLDYAGKKAITFEKDAEDVTAFRKGRAGVKTDGKWGLIDGAGKWICPPAYDDLDIL